DSCENACALPTIRGSATSDANNVLMSSSLVLQARRQPSRPPKLPKERLSDMVRRILRSAYAVGIDMWGPAPEVDMAKHNEIALETARQGIVLLKNESALPLAADKPLKIAVVGGYA